MESLSHYVGKKIDLNQLLGALNSKEKKRLHLFKDRIFVESYVAFQYGQLKPDSKPHQSVIKLLTSYKLLERVSKGLPNSYLTTKDKDKDKDKAKDMDKVKDKEKAKDKNQAKEQDQAKDKDSANYKEMATKQLTAFKSFIEQEDAPF